MRTNTMVARAAVLLGLSWSLSACDDGLTELNQDPNAPTDVPAEFLLPEAIRTGVESSFGATMMLSHTGVFPQHIVQLQYADEETGLVRPQTMDIFWSNYYVGPLKDIQLVIEKSRESDSPRQEGVGLIWRSWLFHQVTDLWGDIPYSEALNGEVNATPAYDAQQDVYNGLLNDLEAGVGLLAGGGTAFGSADILYGGDVERWRRFGNSLRMRLALRLVNVSASAAQAEFVAAYNAGGFESNADNALFRWPGSPYENPLYVNWLTRDDHGIAATLVDTLQSLDDPRLELYAEPAAEDGAYRGSGSGQADPVLSLSWYSRIGDFWRENGAATPTMIMSYAEVLLLQAEAAERGWIAANPADLYEEAIRANMTQYNAFSPANAPTNAEIAAYLAQPEVQYGGLDDIHLQLWIALYMNENEAWSHWRRTGTPDLEMGPDMIVSRIPIRFIYPDSEQSLNSTNLNSAISRQGGGLDLVTPVWWMP